MASLLLGTANVLVLDEPGNHLDVETVEALAEALRLYKGTVIFTSHDRHFMARVATNVIEVRDGRVRNYFGSYDTYCEAVEKEVDEGERARNAASGNSGGKASGKSSGKSSGGDGRKEHRDQRKTGKELKTLERKIAKLDDEKRELNTKLLTETKPDEAVRLHDQVKAIEVELSEAEERWLELSDF
jgi:ATP-binding cassette subfamily F protein 3